MSNTVRSKHQVQCYVDLSRQSLDKFFQRRQFEWKFNLTLWTPIAILIGFALRGDIETGTFTEHRYLTATAHIIVFALYTYWSLGLHSANRMDKKMSDDFCNAAVDYIAERNPLSWIKKVNVPDRKWLWPLKDWSSAVQIFFTLTLLIVNWLVFCFPLSSAPD